jgi:hypothetical protein
VVAALLFPPFFCLRRFDLGTLRACKSVNWTMSERGTDAEGIDQTEADL